MYYFVKEEIINLVATVVENIEKIKIFLAITVVENIEKIKFLRTYYFFGKLLHYKLYIYILYNDRAVFWKVCLKFEDKYVLLSKLARSIKLLKLCNIAKVYTDPVYPDYVCVVLKDKVFVCSSLIASLFILCDT